MEQHQQKFRGNWTPVIGDGQNNNSDGGGVPPGGEGVVVETKVVLKLVYGGVVRLVEVEEPLTVDAIAAKFAELFGVTPTALSYWIPGDDDEIQIQTDDEVALAQRFGGKPLKILGTYAPPEAAEEENVSLFEFASRSLAAHDVDADPAEIELLLKVLQLRPKRLVKFGLAPRPSKTKNNPSKKDDDDDDAMEDDDDDDDDVVVVAAEVTANEEEDQQPDVSTLDLNDKEEGLNDKEDEAPSKEDDEEKNAVVAALRAKGIVKMAPSTIHALLRLLAVPPRRFVKLGLLPDLKAAREAYKCGGRAAAKDLFKSGKCGKKWGRGLCGGHGRGRGRGWMYDQPCPKKARFQEKMFEKNMRFQEKWAEKMARNAEKQAEKQQKVAEKMARLHAKHGFAPPFFGPPYGPMPPLISDDDDDDDDDKVFGFHFRGGGHPHRGGGHPHHRGGPHHHGHHRHGPHGPRDHDHPQPPHPRFRGGGF